MLILQSIKPQYCELIASGKKTIEVRKTRPKIQAPFKVYIYCAKSKEHFTHGGIVDSLDDLYRMPNGEIKYGYSGELMCCNEPYTADNFLNGKVIGEYVCDEIEPKYCANGIAAYYKNEQGTCLSDEELRMYADGVKPLYFWHISYLKIYDKPKELSEFSVIDKEFLKDCPYRIRTYNNPDYTNGALLLGSYACNNSFEPDFCRGQCGGATKPLFRPPQSWCYVEEV